MINDYYTVMLLNVTLLSFRLYLMFPGENANFPANETVLLHCISPVANKAKKMQTNAEKQHKTHLCLRHS